MEKININKNWKFSKDKKEYIDVNIPHTWNGIDGQDGGNDYYRSTCFYRKRINIKDIPKEKLIYLEFEGVNSSATIYINDIEVFHHDGGYSTFRVDITNYLKEDNEILVEVDNSPNDRVYPQRADFTFYGGIYRNVNLIGVNKIHFDLDHYGDNGVRITPKIEVNKATIYFDTSVSNKTKKTSIKYEILDDNKVVASSVDDSTLYIDNVHLWNGKNDPFLYQARITLFDNEIEVDKRVIDFGCRTFKIDPERGFILNEKEYPLHGVSRHQDRPIIGNALNYKHHEEDMNLILEMGANTIRLAHYQHDQYFYDLCDKYGLIVWAEIPYITNHLVNGIDNTMSQMKELIYQNYNHPSIAIWGLSNEISVGGVDNPSLIKNHEMLNKLTHEIDKTRLTTVALIASCKPEEKYTLIPDLIGYNLYFGWYGGNVNMFEDYFENFHKTYPSRSIALSEYGCEALNWHNSNPSRGDYSEEYQAYFHESVIKQLFNKKYIWGTYVWNMFDFAADARNEGGENGMNHKGLVSFDRKYKKDSFYAYKAWLSNEPFVHICSKNYVERVEDITKVTVYSSLNEVSLYVNGKLFETRKTDDHFFNFMVPNVGTNKIEAISNGCKDKSIIKKVDKFNEKYSLGKAKISNWIDSQ